MTLRLGVDVEALVVDYLASVPEVFALVDVRVSTETGMVLGLPLVRVQRIGGTYAVPRWLERARLQIEAWATTKEEANDLIRTIEAAMLLAPLDEHPEGVVTEVQIDLSQLWLPDPETGDARYQSDFGIYVHPSSNEGS
jgi:hypothetical protein